MQIAEVSLAKFKEEHPDDHEEIFYVPFLLSLSMRSPSHLCQLHQVQSALTHGQPIPPEPDSLVAARMKAAKMNQSKKKKRKPVPSRKRGRVLSATARNNRKMAERENKRRKYSEMIHPSEVRILPPGSVLLLLLHSSHSLTSLQKRDSRLIIVLRQESMNFLTSTTQKMVLDVLLNFFSRSFSDKFSPHIVPPLWRARLARNRYVALLYKRLHRPAPPTSTSLLDLPSQAAGPPLSQAPNSSQSIPTFASAAAAASLGSQPRSQSASQALFGDSASSQTLLSISQQSRGENT